MLFLKLFSVVRCLSHGLSFDQKNGPLIECPPYRTKESRRGASLNRIDKSYLDSVSKILVDLY